MTIDELKKEMIKRLEPELRMTDAEIEESLARMEFQGRIKRWTNEKGEKAFSNIKRRFRHAILGTDWKED